MTYHSNASAVEYGKPLAKPLAFRMTMSRGVTMRGLGEPMSYQSMYARRHPEGVPNPYEPAVELYPNYVHGSDYTRPYFGEPYLAQPYNVLEGLGASDVATLAAQYQSQKNLAMVYAAGASASALGLLAFIGAPSGMKTKAVAGGALVGALCGVLSAVMVFGQME
jgi:hypothetical protein